MIFRLKTKEGHLHGHNLEAHPKRQDGIVPQNLILKTIYSQMYKIKKTLANDQCVIPLMNRPENIKNYKKVLIISKQGLRDQALERWTRSLEHLLLFQRTLVQFPASTWHLTTACNSSFKGFMLLSSGLCSHKPLHSGHTYI